jgi:gliding motility-associated-like protein
VKDNLNIEKLFKDKFEHFEGNVNPDLWANISKGMSSNAAVSSGIGLGVKALIVGVSAITVAVTAYFVVDFNQPSNKVSENNIVAEVSVSTEVVKTNKLVENNITEAIIIANENEPNSSENKAEISPVLSDTEVLNSSNGLTESVKNTEASSSLIEQAKTTQTEPTKSGTENTNSEIKTTTEVVSNVDVKEFSEPITPKGKIEYIQSTEVFKFDFKANAQDYETISWNFNDGSTSFDENPTHVFNSIGIYNIELSVVSKDNIVYSETKTIEIKTTASIDNIPNVITPNGDRINDDFIIQSTEINEFEITITNSLGKTVFKSNDKNFIWDGTDMNGNVVEKAIYTYYIFAKGNDGAILKIPGQLYVR